MTKQQRYRGAFLGLACGDAVGTTLEFKRLGSFEPINDMVGGGPFRLEVGQWTDDTSMALCLAESLLEKRGFDPADQMERYVRWYQEGYMSSNGVCFDIGNTVSAALRNFEQTGEPYSGDTHPHSAGNGSIMRLAPVPMAYASQPERALKLAAESSRTTHQAQLAIDGCRYFAGLIIGALNGISKNMLLAAHYSPVPNYWQDHPLAPEMDAVASGSFKRKMPPLEINLVAGMGHRKSNDGETIKGSGYVVESLEAALWAFYHSNSFEEGCLKAANLGDDADTTAAVYGQLAGAFYGEEGIPKKWRDQVTMHDLIVDFADALFRFDANADSS
ncbi:MAG: ADP-ribosylglycohydrolase family protein [Chloroflexota bacterium]